MGIEIDELPLFRTSADPFVFSSVLADVPLAPPAEELTTFMDIGISRVTPDWMEMLVCDEPESGELTEVSLLLPLYIHGNVER